MGQSLEGIRDSAPNPVLRLDTTAASTTRLERYQRTVLVDATSGANQALVKLPAPGECEGDEFSFQVTGGTGTLKVITGVTSWVIDANTTAETLILKSTGVEFLAQHGPT